MALFFRRKAVRIIRHCFPTILIGAGISNMGDLLGSVEAGCFHSFRKKLTNSFQCSFPNHPHSEHSSTSKHPSKSPLLMRSACSLRQACHSGEETMVAQNEL